MFTKDVENENVLIESVPVTENKRDMVQVVAQRDALQAEVDRLNAIIAEAQKLDVKLERAEKIVVDQETDSPTVEEII